MGFGVGLGVGAGMMLASHVAAQPSGAARGAARAASAPASAASSPASAASAARVAGGAPSGEAAAAPLPLQRSRSLTPLKSGGAASRGLPIIVRADSLRGRPDLDTVAEGNAEFRQGTSVLRADRLTYSYADNLARAQGNVRILKDGSRFTGPELQMQIDRFEGYFLEPTYFFSQIGAGGKASRIDFIDSQRLVVTAGTYTSCMPDGTGAPDWIMSADRIKVDLETSTGEAEGAVLRFYGVPILAAPKISFPLSDTRKSGWLPPTVLVDSKSGHLHAGPQPVPARSARREPRIRSIACPRLVESGRLIRN